MIELLFVRVTIVETFLVNSSRCGRASGIHRKQKEPDVLRELSGQVEQLFLTDEVTTERFFAPKTNNYANDVLGEVDNFFRCPINFERVNNGVTLLSDGVFLSMFRWEWHEVVELSSKQSFEDPVNLLKLYQLIIIVF